MTPPEVKLHLFFATQNDRAVILRQGPSKMYRMILWHRNTDLFEDGQWLKHKVYVEPCHLSPDGRHFVFFALDGKWQSAARGSYTAISRPPYFTALSLFPVGDTWSGGGVFVDNRHVLVDGGDDIIDQADGLSRVHLGKIDKGCSTGIRLQSGARAPLTRDATRLLLNGSSPISEPAMRHRIRQNSAAIGKGYVTKGAVLYRLHGDTADPIRDFSDMSFEEVRAPYDGQCESPVSGNRWHPLD